MKLPRLSRCLPSWKSAALAVVSAILLILAFPDFGFWFLAWFALVPLLFAVIRESESSVRCFVVGWLWGIVFFTGTCWWLTFAPITYAAFPPSLAYALLLVVTGIVAIFTGIFASIFAVAIRLRGALIAFGEVPLIWVFCEFLRYWLTGNNWNAIAYSQTDGTFLWLASYGGIYLVGIVVLSTNITVAALLLLAQTSKDNTRFAFGAAAVLPLLISIALFASSGSAPGITPATGGSRIVAVQPNVPMSGLTYEKWKQLREKHVELAESALANPDDRRSTNTTVIFPESPMNFAYAEDEEFQLFVHAFAAKHNVQVLFNSAEPDAAQDKYFNSAVLVGADGREVAQYDKIYLVPFGESVPAPLQSIVPAFVGTFSYGSEYDLLPLGDAKAGVMICFESHFGQLSREYVRNGADAIIEMTNDGYLGPTPILRQHLANAIFRAVETNRPVLRVTNVGITAYITERGEVVDPSESYSQTTRVWQVTKSDGSQTFYVRFGDWVAWLCFLNVVWLLVMAFIRRREPAPDAAAEPPAI